MDVHESSELSKLNVLLFHEDRKQLRYYQTALRFCSLRNVLATDAIQDAIKQTLLDGFDLVLIPCPEEKSTAAALLKEILSTDGVRKVPVVAIMPEEDVPKAMSVMARGVSGVLVEPLSGKSLEALVEKLMRCRCAADPDSGRLKQAVALLECGSAEHAAEIFHELIERDSLAVDAHMGLFQICCARESWLEAENHILKAIEIVKKSGDKVEVHRRLASIFCHYGSFYEKRQSLEKAIKSYRTSVSLDPFSLESVKELLRLLMQRHEINEMVEVIGKAYALLPADSRAVEELALCVSELAGRFSELRMSVPARRLYEQLLSISHTRVEIHLEVAEFFLARGRVSLVLKLLLAVSERIKDSRLFVRIGTLLLENERRYMERGRFDTTGGADLSFFRGLDAKRVLAMAENAFQNARLQDANDPQALLGIARVHLKRRELEAAEERLNQLKEKCGANADLWVEIVGRLLEDRAFDLALSRLNESAKRFPHDARFCGLYAEYFSRRGRENEAMAWLKKGLALEPENPSMVLAVADLYRALGQYPDAALYYRKAEQLLPDDIHAREGLRESVAEMQRSGKK